MAMTLREGLLFAERYRLEEQLGEGGFGEVWKSFDKVTKEFVAIKIHHCGDTQRAAQEIVKEYTRMMTIHHDNLLTPSHVDLAAGNVPYLVMELCEYDLTEHDLVEREVWQLIRDVASGLKRLAENKKMRVRSDGSTIEVVDPIIHQDIKPSNILRRSNGMYAISDFGVSRRRLSTFSTNFQSDQNQGMDSAMTVDYAAPERFPRGVGKALLASDIWSLGATLFELVEGRRPFAEGGGDCLNSTIGLKIPTITRDGFSNELKNLIYDCMAKSPERRPQASQLSEYANQVLQGKIRKKGWKGALNSEKQSIQKPKPTPKTYMVVALLAVVSIAVYFLIPNESSRWKRIQDTGTFQEYYQFCQKYPDGIHIDEARRKMLEVAKSTDCIDCLREIAKHYRNYDEGGEACAYLVAAEDNVISAIVADAEKAAEIVQSKWVDFSEPIKDCNDVLDRLNKEAEQIQTFSEYGASESKISEWSSRIQHAKDLMWNEIESKKKDIQHNIKMGSTVEQKYLDQLNEYKGER